MKRYIILFSLLLTSLFSTAMAQIKGHSYYAFATMLSDEIPSAIMLEVENDGMLALGMIMYEETKEPILLYGRRDRQDKNILHMEEHLLNGQWTGKLDLTIEDGAIKGGVWKTPQEIGDIGQDINPHLWLLLEDRTVQMISLMRFRKRNNLGSGMVETPCDIEGSFMYIHDSENEWEDIIITPIDGLEFTPKNKKAKYTRVHELG